MEQYTVHQVSELLYMPKDTLRYYDKLGLVSSSRGENRYRSYTEQDILDLKYIETMKYEHQRRFHNLFCQGVK